MYKLAGLPPQCCPDNLRSNHICPRDFSHFGTRFGIGIGFLLSYKLGLSMYVLFFVVGALQLRCPFTRQSDFFHVLNILMATHVFRLQTRFMAQIMGDKAKTTGFARFPF